MSERVIPAFSEEEAGMLITAAYTARLLKNSDKKMSNDLEDAIMSILTGEITGMDLSELTRRTLDEIERTAR